MKYILVLAMLVVANPYTFGLANAQPPKHPPITMQIPCHMNMETGRINVDGAFLPRTVSNYNVLLFIASKADDFGWMDGQCKIYVQGGLKD